MANSSDIAQSDLAELLNVLGMGDHARPQSPHEVFQEALRVLRARVGKPAPNSTRTGAAETEDFAKALVKAWEALPGGYHSTKAVERWLCETMHPVVSRARAALAASPEAPSDAGWRERVRHVRRGTEYDVLHRGAELQIATEVEVGFSLLPILHEGARLVIYQGKDGKLWAREESEFDDGRFISAPVAEPAPSGQAEG